MNFSQVFVKQTGFVADINSSSNNIVVNEVKSSKLNLNIRY